MAEVTVKVEIGTHIFEVMECIDEILDMIPAHDGSTARELRARAADLLCDMMVAK